MPFKRNTAISELPFSLVSAADGSAITTGTPVGYYTIAGVQAAIADVTPTYVGNSLWTLNITAAEMNADIVGLTFIHPSAIPVSMIIKTETKLTSELQDITSASIFTTQLIESYAADGVAPTLAQALMLIQQMLTEYSAAGTTIDVKKLDGSTTAATLTLDSTTPTSITRAT